jgi:TolA-binding protein
MEDSMRRLGHALLLVPVLFMVEGLARPALASAGGGGQSASSAQVNAGDIQRLQDAVYDAGTDVRRLRDQDSARASRLQEQLDDLRDEVVYLKVKLRKDGVSRTEYTTLRDRIEELRADARRTPPAAPAAAAAPAAPADARPAAAQDRAPEPKPAQQGTATRPNEVPAGTELDVRLDKPLSSETAQVEDRFTATTVADLYNGNNLLIPAGSAVRGFVTAVTKAGRVERTGKLTLAFDQVTVNGRAYPMHATPTGALQSGGYRQDAGKIGAGAAVGAIIGGILGGGKGALAGILIGGGGVVAATEGQDVNLPAATVLRLRVESPVTVRK